MCFSELNGLRSSLTDGAMKERLKTLAVEVQKRGIELSLCTVYPSQGLHFTSFLQNKKREERLAVLKEGGVLISEKDLKKINTDFDKNKKLWRDRKRKVC